ncbi:MAG: hypothetical protein ACL7BU_14430 [Candidatus Phlomobacter fragariae]
MLCRKKLLSKKERLLLDLYNDLPDIEAEKIMKELASKKANKHAC